MEKITIKFQGQDSNSYSLNMCLVLTKDENGIKACFSNQEEPQQSMDLTDALPKRIVKAFTESGVDRILSKDEIATGPGYNVLDGAQYDIQITKGSVSKDYFANFVSIDVYPLLRYIASFYRTIVFK